MKKAYIIVVVLWIPLLSGCEKSVEKKSPAPPAVGEQIASLLDSQGPNYAGLIEEYRTILAKDPRNLAVIIALGNAYFDSGQWKGAIDLYGRALLISPRNTDVRTDLGTAYRHMGMPDRALAEYLTALHHDPDHLNAHFNMGIVYGYDKKDFKAAIRAWETLLKLAPSHPQAAYIRSGLADFKKALKKGSK